MTDEVAAALPDSPQLEEAPAAPTEQAVEAPSATTKTTTSELQKDMIDEASASSSSSKTPRHMLDFQRQPKAYLMVFLFWLPVLWAAFLGYGWSMDDKIEEEVYNIWTRQRSSFAQDQEYAQALDRATLGATSFAAMAIARDGKNLMTADRLDEIQLRMEETENTTVTYKGNTYSWDDICAANSVGPNTAYQFPCARLSPMDYFQEARWFMDEVDRVTWYREVIKKQVVAPRLPRFGIMQNSCSSLSGQSEREECNDVILHRMQQGEPTLLLADIGNLEQNHPCKMCIEQQYEGTMAVFEERIQLLFGGLLQVATATGQTELATAYQAILESLDRTAVIDFFSYYVTRGLYIELGASGYMASADGFNAATSGCLVEGSGIPCPPPTTEEQAKAALAAHADHAFSSTVTSGNPLPLWGEDGEGFLFQGTSPVGGSGIDMSGSLFSGLFYLQDPANGNFTSMVLTDPVHTWFVASVTPMTGQCGNGVLKGTNGAGDQTDQLTAALMAGATQQWCTKYNIPFEEEGDFTVQYFARMWFDLLIDSPGFLSLTQGESDPYLWTTGQGCGYSLAGSRFAYTTAASQDELMGNVSGQLYYLDEGESLGVVDRNLLMGGRVPRDYSVDNPLEEVTVLQNIYPALLPDGIVRRVQNCNRPDGPIELSLEDAEEVLFQFKEKFENTWTRDWDKNGAGDIAFVGFFDDSGVIGTTGRMLKDITLSNGDLVVVSIAIIAVFSVLFVLSTDPVESRIGITLLGVMLVIFAFFAAVAFGLIVGIKINITIAWTLPFVMLGLGVDDMYMVLLAVREQEGYSIDNFLEAMKEVFVPVTMTSLVNSAMFALMCINDVPAIYLTAQVALISVVFLYLTIICCFTAWCFLDMKRQADNRYDIVMCKKAKEVRRQQGKMWASVFYEKFYHPLLLRSENHKALLCSAHLLVWLGAAALLGLGIWGLTEDQRQIGLGLEDFFPKDNQASKWATMRTEELASWSIQMNWGEVDYTDPMIQMGVIKQFEDVVATPNVAEVDTELLWIADFLVWTTTQCGDNFVRDDPLILECGMNQVYTVDNSTCSGTWVPNSLGLREKTFADLDTCVPYDGGICRPTEQMHPLDLATLDTADSDSWCPVFEDWDTGKISFCVGKWRELSGGRGSLVLKNETGTPSTECSGEYLKDELVDGAIPYAAGPTMFAFDLFSHDLTIDMIEETRAICDEHTEIHCWMSGIPFDYWSQYVGIFNTFWEIGIIAVATGFGVAFLFLFAKLSMDGIYSKSKVFCGSFMGALLISITTTLSLISVSGLSTLFDVSLTGFSLMSFVLSVGFAVEYAVHIVARWLMADKSIKTSLERVEYTMEFLFLPTFMSFVSSTIGVACLAFTEFEFNEVFFFRPLMITMLVTYFFGCWWLPVCLTLLDFDSVRFGGVGGESQPEDAAAAAVEPVTEGEKKLSVPEGKVLSPDSASEEIASSDD